MSETNKVYVAIMAVVAAFLLLVFFNFAANLQFDNGLNAALNPVDKGCSVDSDCIKLDTNCNTHCGSTCANKNWAPTCPFPEQQFYCAHMPVELLGTVCRCNNNLCEKYNTVMNKTI